MTDDKEYDRDKQKNVGWSWVRKNIIITTEINVAMYNIGHEVTNNAKNFSRRKTRAKCTFMQ